MQGRNLRLLALDGDSMRGEAMLQILKQLMLTIMPDSPPKPCDVFEMIGGSGAGGFV